MANELEILTENAAGTSWVDLIPAAVSTGYQAQNTNIEANRNGIDSSYVRYDSGTDEIVIDPSGPIDVNGVPFSVKSEIRLANPGAGTWYLKVVAGADDTLKSIVAQASMGAWVAAKNGLYDGGERVLNWVLQGDGDELVSSKIMPIEKGIINTNGYLIDLSGLSWIPSESIKESFTSPSTAPSSITYDTSTGNLISCDTDSDTIYVHDGISSTILTSFASPGAEPRGLAYDETSGNLISLDASTSRIYIHNGISSTILSDFATPAAGSRDIVYDHLTGNLISCSIASDLIYVHDGISSTILTSFASPGGDILGLCIDYSSGNLISSDVNTLTVYVHDGVSIDIIKSITFKESIRGICIDRKTNNLIACRNTSDLIEIHRKQLFNMS